MRAVSTALLILLGVGAFAVYLSAFTVHQNEQALVLEFGKWKRTIEKAGLHWKIPVVETVEFFDKRILDLDLKPEEVTETDQKLIEVDAYVRYRIKDPILFYQTVRQERQVPDRLGPIVQSRLRSVLAGASLLDIVKNKREQLMRKIAQEVNEQGKQFGLEVVDVRIKRADLKGKNLDSVYERMKAERKQQAEELRAQGRAAKNKISADADRDATVTRAEAYRLSEQIRGEGDGERNRIFAEAFGKDPEFAAFYRHMQAYEAALKSNDTRLLLSPDSEFFKYFNALGTSKPAASGEGGQPKQ